MLNEVTSSFCICRFMESFQTLQMGDQIVVPANCLDRWFIKFQDKFRRDPDFLTRRADQM